MGRATAQRADEVGVARDAEREPLLDADGVAIPDVHDRRQRRELRDRGHELVARRGALQDRQRDAVLEAAWDVMPPG
jgi:hypothetical protein